MLQFGSRLIGALEHLGGTADRGGHDLARLGAVEAVHHAPLLEGVRDVVDDRLTVAGQRSERADLVFGDLEDAAEFAEQRADAVGRLGRAVGGRADGGEPGTDHHRGIRHRPHHRGARGQVRGQHGMLGAARHRDDHRIIGELVGDLIDRIEDLAGPRAQHHQRRALHRLGGRSRLHAVALGQLCGMCGTPGRDPNLRRIMADGQ